MSTSACTSNYLSGFCPLGIDCKHVHPRLDLPTSDPNIQLKKGQVVCHNCFSTGHKIYSCPKLAPEECDEIISSKLQLQQYEQQKQQQFIQQQQENNQNNQNQSDKQQNKDNKQHRPLDQVTCYKCGERGHYANRRKKGYLAFLSSSLKNLQNNNLNNQAQQNN